MELQTVSIEEVIQIHESLVRDFAASDNPLEPPGIRSMALLESAVSRQLTSMGGQLKYPEALGNAATLAYGVCNDHPFHNGNKRTALVAMLVHLDKNKLVLKSTRDTELFDLIIATATHTACLTREPSRKHRSDYPHEIDSDREVLAIKQWLQRRADKLIRGERQITFRQLRRLLEKFGYALQNPHRNSIDVVKVETVKEGIIKKRSVTRYKHIGAIDFPGDGEFVAVRVLKYVRKLCRLTEEDGVDSDSFYDEPAVVDAFINRYRTVLRRLSKR